MVSTRLAMSESRSRGYNGRASPGGRSLSDGGARNVLCVPLTAQSDGRCLGELCRHTRTESSGHVTDDVTERRTVPR